MTQEILLQLLLGGLLGAIGQSLRIIVGLKKMNDEAVQKGIKVADLISTSSMLLSLLIGFCAGILVVISISNFEPGFFHGDKLKQNILSIVAAGYAGTDFIEGFIRKFLPDPNPTSPTTPNPYNGKSPVNNPVNPPVPAPGKIKTT